ncbi:restriction endonuclease subunit S [Vibrio cholerae]|nr:restriction endonuclease subunit S [Vibrio cholerae]GIA11527.1 restriction endonuclease subunit S [Vibrio cholerae]
MTKNLSSDSILHSNPKDTIMLGGLKRVDFGFIPDDWLCLTLSEICELTSSKRIFESDYVSDGIPFYRGQEVSSLLLGKRIEDVIYIDKDKFEKLKAKFGAPEQGDILITAVGTLGNSFLVNNDEPFYFKDGNLIWARKIKNTNPRFLLALLEFNKQRVLATAIGSSQKALTMAALKPLQLPIPSSPAEQTAIANALSDVDALIQELEKLIVKKQAIKTATMQQLLTGRTRLPQFAHHPDGRKKGYKPSELGEIPEDWEVVNLGEISAITKLAGFEYTNYFNSYRDGGDIIVIRGTNITENFLDLNDIKTIPRSTSNMLPRSQLNAGDLVFAYVGTVGPVFLIREDNKYHLGPNTAKITCNNTVVSEFLRTYFTSELIKIQIDEHLSIGAQPSLSMGKIRSFKIVLPCSKDEQIQIDMVISSMEEEMQSLKTRINKTRQIKQGMMQELLTGKTRLIKPAGAA